MYNSSFNVILGDNEKQITFESSTTTYSDNIGLINNYIFDLDGFLVNFNTARFYSEQTFNEFVKKLLEF